MKLTCHKKQISKHLESNPCAFSLFLAPCVAEKDATHITILIITTFDLWVVFKCLSEAQTLRVCSSSRFIVIIMADAVWAGWMNSSGFIWKLTLVKRKLKVWVFSSWFLWRRCLQCCHIHFFKNHFWLTPPPLCLFEFLLSFAANVLMSSLNYNASSKLQRTLKPITHEQPCRKRNSLKQ